MPSSEAQTILVVFSNPVAGREEEYNEWYTDVHIPEVLAGRGYIAAQRFALSETQPDGVELPLHRYMAVYELGIDAAEALDELSRPTSNRTTTDTIDKGSVLLYWTTITPRIESESVTAPARP
jgi:hypothetical protein